MPPTTTAIRLFVVVLITVLGVALIPSPALADTQTSPNGDVKGVCSMTGEGPVHTQESDETSMDSEAVLYFPGEIIRASPPAEPTAIDSELPEVLRGSLQDSRSSSTLTGASDSVSDAVQSSVDDRHIRMTARDEVHVVNTEQPVDVAAANFRGIQLRQTGGLSDGAGPGSTQVPAVLLLFVLGACIGTAVLTVRGGHWRSGSRRPTARYLSRLIAKPSPSSDSVRDGTTSVSEGVYLFTKIVLDRMSMAPSHSHNTASTAPPRSTGSRHDTQSIDVSIDDRDLLPDEAYVESILDERGGRMKQGQIVDTTEWSKAKVSRLLSAMDDEGRIVKIQIGRENLICLAGEEPEIAVGTRSR